MRNQKKKLNVLVVVDMQNDFITGSLANPETEKTVPGIRKLIEGWAGNNGKVILTQDTHDFDYLKTQEGRKLPTEHCIKGTGGWCIHDSIQRSVYSGRCFTDNNYPIIYEKESFGSKELAYYLKSHEDELADVVFVGTCTDICVITNALIAKTFVPEARIVVLSDLCSGTCVEMHGLALAVMESCQIEVMESEKYLKSIKEAKK